MKTLTFWARDHRWTARIIIIFIIYPLMNLVGWFLGDMLAFNGVHINPAWGYPLSFFFLLLFLIYPFGADRKYRNYYLWKRSVDAMMIIASFCFILLRGNGFHAGTSSNPVTASHATVTSVASETDPSPKAKKEKKKGIKKIIQNLRSKYKNASKADKTAMIILAVVVAVLLLFGLFALTCSIACSGAEGLAYVVFFLGLGGIVFGLVRVIRRIKLGPRKKREAAKAS